MELTKNTNTFISLFMTGWHEHLTHVKAMVRLVHGDQIRDCFMPNTEKKYAMLSLVLHLVFEEICLFVLVCWFVKASISNINLACLNVPNSSQNLAHTKFTCFLTRHQGYAQTRASEQGWLSFLVNQYLRIILCKGWQAWIYCLCYTMR